MSVQVSATFINMHMSWKIEWVDLHKRIFVWFIFHFNIALKYNPTCIRSTERCHLSDALSIVTCVSQTRFWLKWVHIPVLFLTMSNILYISISPPFIFIQVSNIHKSSWAIISTDCGLIWCKSSKCNIDEYGFTKF